MRPRIGQSLEWIIYVPSTDGFGVMVDIPMRKREATSKAEYWDTKLIELRHSQLVDGRAVCGKLEGSANAHTVGGVPLTTGVSSLTVVNECPDAGAAPDE